MRSGITKTYLTDLIYQVNGAAIEVHKHLGPGLLESVYHKCMKHELAIRNINFKSEVAAPINFKGLITVSNLRCDLFVEDILPVELKSVETMKPLFEAQTLSYMRLLKVPKGLLINFNVVHIYSQGQKTFVNELYRNLPD